MWTKKPGVPAAVGDPPLQLWRKLFVGIISSRVRKMLVRKKAGKKIKQLAFRGKGLTTAAAQERRKGKSAGEFFSCFVCYNLSEAAAFHLIGQYCSATLIKVILGSMC